MARLADDNSDKALWLALAQSWVMLAEHVSRRETTVAFQDDAAEDETLGDRAAQPS
jgi:hypothetical protein